MKVRWWSLGTVVLSSLLLSCAEGERPSESSQGYFLNRTFSLDFEKSRHLNIICGQSECPSAVFELHARRDSFQSRCSGVLLNTGEVLTASHCLSPHHLVENRCSDSVFLRSMSHVKDAVECRYVKRAVDLKGVERGTLTQDWAFLEVSSWNLSAESPFYLVRSYQPRVSDTFEIWWIKDLSQERVLIKSECPSLKNNPFTHEAQTSGQQGWFVGPCDIVPGASGGAVVLVEPGSDQKKVVGVMSQASKNGDWAYLSFVE